MTHFPCIVELFHVDGLPRHLLGDPCQWDLSSDLDLAAARDSHWRSFEEQERYIRETDYQASLAEYRASLPHLSSMDALRRITEDERDAALRLEHLVLGDFEGSYRLLNSSFFSLLALQFLHLETSLDQILARLGDQSWATRHEVLTRWGWLRAHRGLLAKGIELAWPYRCRLASRQEPGNKEDREFYTFLQFLHWLRAKQGQELLFVEKRQTPDFSAEDAAGGSVGVEVSHIAVSDQADTEADARKAVTSAVRGVVPTDWHPTVGIRRSWRPARERLPELEKWLVAKLDLVEPTEEQIEFVKPDMGLRIGLKRIPGAGGYVSSHLEGPTSGGELEEDARKFASTLRQRIENKIWKTKKGSRKLRRQPGIRPCYLVLYPEHELGEYMDLAIEEFRRLPTVDVSSHFDQVWLSGEFDFERLL